MQVSERDNEQLGLILKYCNRMSKAMEHFNSDYGAFTEDPVFQDSCTLCLIQIGEAVNRLSEDFTKSNPQIEWSRIYGLRCHLVHGYEMFDAEIAWDAMQNDIPQLREFCEERFVD